MGNHGFIYIIKFMDTNNLANEEQTSTLSQHHQDILDDIQEDIAELNEADTPTTWEKFKTSILLVAAVMMSAGQFNDTRDLAASLHDDIVAKFTHEIEYELINGINIGNSLAYVKSHIGEPQIIKHAKIHQGVIFHYYHQEKFSLTLISKDERVVGLSVTPNTDNFQPKMPYKEALGSQTIKQAVDEGGKYAFDTNNLLYFIEAEELGKKAMYLTLIRGFIGYGAQPESNYDIETFKPSLISLLNKLQTAEETIDDTQVYEAERDAIVSQIRDTTYPNYFAITELGAEVVTESLLTRYEHQAYSRN